jgi:hypothetical protein
LAAVPGAPGLSWATVYYHSSIDAGPGQQFPGDGGEIRVGIEGDADLVLLSPSYAFADPVLGGQLSLSLLWGGGHGKGSVAAELTGQGNTISGSLDDSVWVLRTSLA